MSDENYTPATADDRTEDEFGSASPVEHTAASTDSDEAVADTAQYGVGPFTIREVALLGLWLVAFVVSFFSIWVDIGGGTSLVPLGSVWTSGIDWVLTIGVPTVAVFLIVLRRFSPDGIRRVGSLAVDQFASVAFSVSAVVWLGILWSNIARAVQTGLWLSSWVVWVEFFLMFAGVFLTVLAPYIQPFNEDFDRRVDVPAHRNARPVRPVIARPVAPAPVDPSPYAAPAPAPADPSPYAGPPAYDAPAYEASLDAAPVDEASVVPQDESASAADDTSAFPFVIEEDAPVEQPAASQAFWALAPVEREVVDENGLPLFSVGPTAWALVIEDRGDRFVVRHEDGRVGYLTDISGVTRG